MNRTEGDKEAIQGCNIWQQQNLKLESLKELIVKGKRRMKWSDKFKKCKRMNFIFPFCNTSIHSDSVRMI